MHRPKAKAKPGSEGEEFSYADSGVDRELRARSKEFLGLLECTYSLSEYGGLIHLPYGNLIPFRDVYLDLVVEGVGTKVLVAQLAEKYDTIGIDGVAMAVNDAIRSGAKPVALADNVHAQKSYPGLVRELLKGVAEGAKYAGCPVIGGEIGDVAEIIHGLTESRGFDLVVACIGEVSDSQVIKGVGIQPGDAIIGLRSSGIHSNGVTLARKVLLEKWGGRFEAFDVPDGFGRPIVSEVLEPTRIYVKPFLKVSRETNVKAAVHITGDAYLKFERLMPLNPGVGFEFSNFKPHPIFHLIQETAEKVRGPISDLEMLCTFNMGWGLAFVVDDGDVDRCLDLLEAEGEEAEVIGYANDMGHISVRYRGERIILR